MSFFSKIAGNVKNAVVKGAKDTGHALAKGAIDTGHAVGEVADNKWAKLAAAGLLAATGVGAGPAALIMGTMGAAGGALKPHGGLKPAVTGGITGAVEGYGAGKLGAAIHGAGAAAATEGASNAIPTFVSDGDRAWQAAQSAPSIMDRIGSGAQAVGSGVKQIFSKDNGDMDWGKVAQAGTAAAGLYSQHQATDKQNEFYDKTQSTLNPMMDLAMKNAMAGSNAKNDAMAKLAAMGGTKRKSDIFRGS